MSTAVVMPQLGESIAEGTLARWLKKVGDRVERDEPLCEISTDKVDAEIPSPTTGILTDIRIPVGQTVPVQTVIAVIASSDAVAASELSNDRKPEGVDPESPQQRAASRSLRNAGPVKSSPVVRRIAREHDVDIADVPPSGPTGRVTKGDILAFLERRDSLAPRRRDDPEPGNDAAAQVPSETLSESSRQIVPLTVMRRKIAEHMMRSRRTSAHVHTVFHVNFSGAARVRDLKKGEFARAGVKLTYLSFIAKAVVDVLQHHPVINSSLEGDNIIYKRDVHLGIAVALDDGLIVPVIRDASEKGLLGLGRAIADLASRARGRQLRPDEVEGGTFTITNPGMFGSQFAMPIINQPQVAILGVGAIEKRPVVVDDAIGIRTMAYLTLGFDHRLVDGVVADAFMADVKRRIENVETTTL